MRAQGDELNGLVGVPHGINCKSGECISQRFLYSSFQGVAWNLAYHLTFEELLRTCKQTPKPQTPKTKQNHKSSLSIAGS